MFTLEAVLRNTVSYMWQAEMKVHLSRQNVGTRWKANRARMQQAPVSELDEYLGPRLLNLKHKVLNYLTRSEITASTKLFTAPAFDGRTSGAYSYNIASGILGGSETVIDPRMNGHIFPKSTPTQLLPTPYAGMDNMVNISQFQTPTDKTPSSWIYAPVDVYYHSGIDTHQTDWCVYERLSAQVKVQSQGLNYIGAYTDTWFSMPPNLSPKKQPL